jgi:CRISPR-associated protein Csd1
MSVLAALVRAYDERTAFLPADGYSIEKIGFVLSLNDDGTIAGLHDIRQPNVKGLPIPRRMAVPTVNRSSGVASAFGRENAEYLLGLGDDPKTPARHAEFKRFQLSALAGETDEGLVALRRFVERWQPSDFDALAKSENLTPKDIAALKTTVIGIALESERLAGKLITDRPIAKQLWNKLYKDAAAGLPVGVCAVTGQCGPTELVHPKIKGMPGAGTGAALVSFNFDATLSYGHKKSENAQVGRLAAMKYTTALNFFLDGIKNRLKLGDITVVFWAECESGAVRDQAEDTFLRMLEAVDQQSETDRVADIIRRIRRGEPLATVAPELTHGVRFYVLGLGVNSGRLMMRFFLDNDFGFIAANYQRFLADIAVEPAPRKTSLWHYLNGISALPRKPLDYELSRMPPNVTSEWLRSIVEGTNYPAMLLESATKRMRVDPDNRSSNPPHNRSGNPLHNRPSNPLRAAVCRAVLTRNYQQEVPVALDTENTNAAYVRGRLFAVLEHVQYRALGKVTASISTKYLASAMDAPREALPMLIANAEAHLNKIGKKTDQRGSEVKLRRLLGEIIDLLPASGDAFPAVARTEDTGFFVLGYYHQRQEFFRKKGAEVESEIVGTDDTEIDHADVIAA